MRISSSQFFQTGINAINQQQSDLMHLYQQVASGQRMVTPADDPLGAAQAVNLSQSRSMNTRYAANRDVANQGLGSEENALNSVTTLLQDVQTRLIQAGNGTLSDADRSSLADVLAQARDSLLDLANSKDGNGQYLFSGFQGNSAPYVTDALGQINYAGDGNQRLVQVDPTRQMASGDIGSDIFSRSTPGSRVSVTEAAAGNTGSAQISTPTITDAQGANVGKYISIKFSDGPPLQYQLAVSDSSAPPAAADYGTPVDYDPDTSVLDLGGGMQVKFSGQPAAGDSFTVSPADGQNMDVFDALDDIVQALRQPFSGDDTASAALGNSLSTAIQRVGAVYDNVLTVRASVGARMNQLDALNSSGAAMGLSYSTQLSNLQDVDYYTATAQLQLRQSALQAAALAFKQIQGTSLFNMGSSS